MLEFSSEQNMLRETVAHFAEKEVAPLAYDIDRDERFPSESFKRLADLGLLGITVPVEHGGAGAGYTEMCIVTEELARFCGSTAATYADHADLCIDNIRRNANGTQKEKYLPPLCRGEKIGGLAMTEPSAGSDVMSMNLRAERKGDHYVLNGTKVFITNGPVGDVFVIYAKTAPEKKAHGVSAFIIEKDFPGFSRGKKFEKMGWRGSPTGELIFEDCEIPAENVVGVENAGIRVLMNGLDRERIVYSICPIGVAQGAFDVAFRYAQERVQFGLPIVHFQMIQEMLAEMATEIQAARLMAYWAATLADQGGRVRLEASYAKLFCSQVGMRAVDKAVQILGGYGFISEFPVERMYRDMKGIEFGAGTTQIQKLIIVQEMLKKGGI